MGEGPGAGSGVPQPNSGSTSGSYPWGDLAAGDPLITALLERAEQLQGDTAGLLALLRSIEAAHRAIQEGPFRSSLPEDRNRLFELLANMERSGGWPYIPRLQLRTFLDLLQPEGPPDRGPSPGSAPAAEDHSSDQLAA
ncbi:MAG: hypothetical protein VKI42_05635 [Synechococcaceae cyanobacterium]|nr:hypothetical protein [Synechococcaceae cyanobacterium]